MGYSDGWNLYGAYLVPNHLDPEGLKICIGKARVLKGNKRHIGKRGGLEGNGDDGVIEKDDAAVDPKQWTDGSKAGLRIHRKGITGTFTDSTGATVGSFDGIGDIIGGEKDPVTGENPRDKLKRLNPGVLIIELVGGEDLETVTATITVPDGCPCPKGTTEKAASP